MKKKFNYSVLKNFRDHLQKYAKISALASASEIRIAESSNIIRFAPARTVLPAIYLLFTFKHDTIFK